MDKFGWFYKRNGTTWSDGVVNMKTGEKDFTELGNIDMWHGQKRTRHQGHCGELTGTAAGFMSPDSNRQFIDFFSTDICKPIRFQNILFPAFDFDRHGDINQWGYQYQIFHLYVMNTSMLCFRFERDELEFVEGVESIKYSVIPRDTFGNSVTNPDNVCYENNLPYGVHNSTGCKGGDTTLKTFVSLPHFLGAHPSFAEQFAEGN